MSSSSFNFSTKPVHSLASLPVDAIFSISTFLRRPTMLFVNHTLFNLFVATTTHNRKLSCIGEWLCEKQCPERQEFFRKWIPCFILNKLKQKDAWNNLFLYRKQQIAEEYTVQKKSPFTRFLEVPGVGLVEGGPYGALRIFHLDNTVNVLENSPGAFTISPFVADMNGHVIKDLALLSNNNIATLTESGMAQIWNLSTKELVATLPEHHCYVRIAAWADGGVATFTKCKDQIDYNYLEFYSNIGRRISKETTIVDCKFDTLMSLSDGSILLQGTLPNWCKKKKPYFEKSNYLEFWSAQCIGKHVNLGSQVIWRIEDVKDGIVIITTGPTAYKTSYTGHRLPDERSDIHFICTLSGDRTFLKRTQGQELSFLCDTAKQISKKTQGFSSSCSIS